MQFFKLHVLGANGDARVVNASSLELSTPEVGPTRTPKLAQINRQ